MRKMLLFFGALTVMALIINYSCKKESEEKLPGLLEISVTPGDTAIDIGESVQYRAVGLFLDSTTRDITSEVTWLASPSGKISISSTGLATASAVDSAYIVALGGGIDGGAILVCDTGESLKRTMAILDYEANYLGSEISGLEFEWTGNVANCKPGSNPAAVHNKVAQRINYYRRLCLLPSNVTLDAGKNKYCMYAALIMSANNNLSHTPDPSWTCYSDSGSVAAGNSNIALGMHSVYAVDGYIEDNGANNLPVGHRRWLLYSRARVMGDGSTTNSNAIWVMGNNTYPVPSGVTKIAYPPQGFVPAPLIYDRWSLGVPDDNADFATAAVNMLDENNAPVGTTIISRDQGYGDNTIVWEPSGINLNGPGDVTYTVSVTNVKIGGTPTTYTYKVIIIQVPGPKMTTYTKARKQHPEWQVK